MSSMVLSSEDPANPAWGVRRREGTYLRRLDAQIILNLSKIKALRKHKLFVLPNRKEKRHSVIAFHSFQTQKDNIQ